MQKNILLKTSLFVCLIIIIGFTVVVSINYSTSQRANMGNIEQISALTSEGIFYRIGAIFAKPVNTSLAMAASPLLKDLLLSETELEDEDYTRVIQEYLNTYKEENGYDSVFLASAKTNRYYNYSGVDRVLDESNPENTWYYSFLESGDEYSLNVDNDEAAQDEITIFVNCRIKGAGGTTLGVVGVGLRYHDLQSTLEEYATEYGTDLYLINTDGGIEVAADNSGFLPVSFFDECGYPQYKDEILSNTETEETLVWWLTEHNERNYVMARYIPELNRHLIVEHNTAIYNEQADRQLLRVVLAAFTTGLLVLMAITYTITRFNKQITTLTIAIEQEKRAHIVRLAQLDGLTNVYNKSATEHQIGQMLGAAKEACFAFFIIDIDNFKQINDTYGHAFGDIAIIEFVSIVKSCFRGGDIIGRIGGDEFVAFLTVPDEDWAKQKAAELSKALDTKISSCDICCKISASIGVAVASNGTADFETLYKNADSALYETKRRCKNGFSMFEHLGDIPVGVQS